MGKKKNISAFWMHRSDVGHDGHRSDCYVCSECGARSGRKTKTCRNCYAVMDEIEEEIE